MESIEPNTRVKVAGTWPEGATGTVLDEYYEGAWRVQFDEPHDYGLVQIRIGFFTTEYLIKLGGEESASS